jgi:DNA-binding winged helix-turn-helix (wHTH) protein
MAAKVEKQDLLQKVWDGTKMTQTADEVYNEILSETESNE